MNESDVIHASAKDVPCIFRITTSMIGDNRDGKNDKLFRDHYNYFFS